ncbi:MAG: GTPase Era [Spirochaetales bacterium]|nr:GTPase Era [Spirochaetales bacterium]
MKSGFVEIIGRPSSGKSTLVNALCGYKVSIVSTVPQTTRNKIRGVLTTDAGQLVFVDTPGFHTSQKRLNLHLKDLVVSNLQEVDLILYVLDATRPPKDEEKGLLEIVAENRKKTVAAINKIDAAENGIEMAVEFLETELPSERIFKISALEKMGLESLVGLLFALAPEGDLMYPGDMYTDQSPDFRASEIIREKAITRMRQEVPHAIYASIEDMEPSEDGERLWIRAFLNVERESQKGIVVGKGGKMIREIRLAAQKELSEIFPYRVDLDLRVKVVSDWRKRENLLKKLIY